MDDFVARAYRLALRREPDPEGAAAARAALAAGTLSRAGLLAGLVASPEFAELRGIDDALARARTGPLHDLHAPPGTSERAIEMPWVLSRLHGAARVLDVGYANAPAVYIDALLGAAPAVAGVDLVPGEVAGMECVVADVRDLPWPDGAFDAIACISTIEHVGMDNRVYGVSAERDPDGMVTALGELARVLAPGGRLLVTTPVGVPEDHGWFIQQPAVAWLELYGSAGLRPVEHEVYELGPGGWGHVTGEPPVRYGERGPAASAVLCAALTTPA